ncbi:MAG: cupin-like domain-containing protein, partial [Acidobacteriota bacterium]
MSLDNITVRPIDGLTQQIFERDFMLPGLPVIITGAISEWKALSLWTPEYLREKVGTKRITLACSKTRSFNYDINGASYDRKEVDFNEAVSLLCGEQPAPIYFYLMQQSIVKIFPELSNDISVPALINRDKISSINLWFSSAGNITPLHWDLANNFLVQIYGRKRLVLFDPMQTNLLYPHPLESASPHLSYVDLNNPDYEKFPKLRMARGITGIIKPGDIVYLPPYWWHHVISETVGISVNIWWRSLVTQGFVPCEIRHFPYSRHRLTDYLRQRFDLNGFSNFIDVADYAFNRGFKPAALLIAEAAFEEHLRALGKKHKIE